jgi:hypothetical protein
MPLPSGTNKYNVLRDNAHARDGFPPEATGESAHLMREYVCYAKSGGDVRISEPYFSTEVSGLRRYAMGSTADPGRPLARAA